MIRSGNGLFHKEAAEIEWKICLFLQSHLTNRGHRVCLYLREQPDLYCQDAWWWMWKLHERISLAELSWRPIKKGWFACWCTCPLCLSHCCKLSCTWSAPCSPTHSSELHFALSAAARRERDSSQHTRLQKNNMAFCGRYSTATFPCVCILHVTVKGLSWWCSF